MTAFRRLLAGAARVRVLAAARVRTVTAGSTAVLRAAATRASALLRPGANYLRDGSPRWRATVRPAMDNFLQRPDDLRRRTRDSLLRVRPLILRDSLLRVRPVLSELRSSLPSTDSLRPALRDLVQAVPRPLGGDGDEALRRRLLERLPRLRLRRGTERGPRAHHVEPHGDDVLVDDVRPDADDDDDRMAATLHAALRRLSSTRLWKAFWDAFLDLHRLKKWFHQLRQGKKTPAQRPRRLPLRPARPRTTPRPIPSSSSALR